jgi:Na+-translocating ferredoxin:NAD+ oxidoreductase subunit D
MHNGTRGLGVLLCSLLGSLAGDAIADLLRRRTGSLNDGHAVFTGLMIGLLLPASVPVVIAALAGSMAILFGKQLMGGLSAAIFHPAILGRVLAVAAFPAAFTAVDSPIGLSRFTLAEAIGGCYGTAIGDCGMLTVVIAALGVMVAGAMTWEGPLGFLTVTLGLTAILSGYAGIATPTGSLFLVGLFCVSDPFTAPRGWAARLAFGAACGGLTILFRLRANHADAALFAVLVMNCFGPLFDRASARLSSQRSLSHA